MKGILLKDWYTILNRCKLYMILILWFSILGGVVDFSVYIAYFLSATLVFCLLVFEDQDKWEHYAATLPYTRMQFVSAKYVMALAIALFTVTAIVISQFVLADRQEFDGEKLISTLLVFPLQILPASCILPFAFKFHAYKGAFAVASSCFSTALVVMMYPSVEAKSFINIPIPAMDTSFLIFTVSWVLFIISWILSVCLYQTREL